MKRLAVMCIQVFIPVFFAIGISVRVGMGLLSTGRDSDPFVSYDALMPGQPLSAMEHFSCLFQQVGSIVGDVTFCQMRPPDGSFRSVIATLQSGSVQELTFQVQGLAIGDIIRHWGQPERITQDARYFYLTWKQGVYVLIEPVEPIRRFSLLISVKQLIFTAEPQIS